MKRAFLAFVVVWTSFAGPLQNTTVQGIVKNHESGQPLAGAQVTLTVTETPPDPLVRLTPAPDMPPEALQSMNEALVAANVRIPLTGTPVPRPASLTATTDASGRFQIPNVAPGAYTLSARREGFVGRSLQSGVSPPAATTLINVIAGQQPADVELTLVEGGTVDGRVTDLEGKPLAGFAVVPFLFTYRAGLPTIVPGGPTRPTNNDGTYHLSALGPGEYYIAAMPPRPSGPTSGDVRTRTFYPSTFDPLTVAPLKMTGKSAFRGIDIRMQNAKTFSVRGRAINSMPPLPPRRFPSGDVDASVQTFSVVPRNADLTENPATIQSVALTEQARRNGEFEIRGIRPGLYDIFPVVPNVIDGEPRYASGRVAVEVRDRDVEGLVIGITPGVDLSGHVTVKGNTAKVKVDTLRVSVTALDNIPAPIVSRIGAARVQPDGSFAIEQVPEALYALTVGPLPPSVYLADIRHRDLSVFDSGFRVGKEPLARLEVVLNTDGQELEGVVVDAGQNAVADARVVLVPPVNRRRNGALYRTATTGKDGRFKLTDVPPGEYRAFASKSIVTFAWQNPNFIAQYEMRGAKVNVQPGAIPKLQLITIER